MSGICIEERDGDEWMETRRASHDAILAQAYHNGRQAGLQGHTPCGRPDDTEEAKQWLEGYRSGVAERLVKVQRAEVERLKRGAA